MSPPPNTPAPKSRIGVPCTAPAVPRARRTGTAKENTTPRGGATSAKQNKNLQPLSPSQQNDESTLQNILNRMGKIEAENSALKMQLQDAHNSTSMGSGGQMAVQVHGDENEETSVNETEARLAELEKELEKERASNQDLQDKLKAQQDKASQAGDDEDADEGSIPRPRGSSGNGFSIQVAMGLATSDKKKAIYTGVQRYLRDLALSAHLNWELSWAEIPAEAKVKMYKVAHENHPFLKQYQNDWATEEIVKQYFKNKRKHAYKSKWLEPPTKYQHLTEASQKRTTSGSRVKKATIVLATKKAKKAAHAANTKKHSSSSKGKKKAIEQQEDIDDEQEQEEMMGDWDEDVEMDNDFE
ncbi:hypothetical protein BYT27DRAFT_7309677 [Phlegmacium glaucopus]|nr:hypothetical protein BYT27DRAFT_7309677 [Phlegmacium glaucopus]